MQTLERALAKLVDGGQVERGEALSKASKPDELMRLLGEAWATQAFIATYKDRRGKEKPQAHGR